MREQRRDRSRRSCRRRSPPTRRSIAERLREAIGTADDERIRAEIALFATKVDVAEELDRLRAHLDEIERVLRKGGAVGKRLDFIAQELNREANTLAVQGGERRRSRTARSSSSS